MDTKKKLSTFLGAWIGVAIYGVGSRNLAKRKAA